LLREALELRRAFDGEESAEFAFEPESLAEINTSIGRHVQAEELATRRCTC